MKALNMKCMTTAALLLAVISCGAGEPQLKLHGKTVTIYRVLQREWKQEDSAAQASRGSTIVVPLNGDVGQDEVIGVSLERWGMLPRASAAEFPVDIVGDDLTESVKKPGAFPDKPLATDYALVLLFEIKDTEGKLWVRAQAVMTDSSGRVVWAQRPGEFASAGNTWPLGLSHQITQSLLTTSDLIKTEKWPEPGPFEIQLRKKFEARSKARRSRGEGVDEKMETGDGK